MLPVHVPPAVALAAVRGLARVDYAVANRVTDAVADATAWAYAHDAPAVADAAVRALQAFDDLGSVLIALVVWLVAHAR